MVLINNVKRLTIKFDPYDKHHVDKMDNVIKWPKLTNKHHVNVMKNVLKYQPSDKNHVDTYVFSKGLEVYYSPK